MEGLKKIPDKSHLRKVYDRLQSGDESVTEGSLALWSQWARLDPRLAEILTRFIFRFWRRFSPIELHDEFFRQPWPAVCGVFIEQILTFYDFKDEGEKKLFLQWGRFITTNLDMAPWEQFFIGQRAFASTEMKKDVELSLDSYLKWGYFGREILINKAFQKEKGRTLIPFENRKAILLDLIRGKSRIRAKDYINALDGRISHRQAQYDLKSCKFLQRQGRTKSSSYKVVG